MKAADAEASIVTDTMRFAKRQMTWFRRQAEVLWFREADEARRAVRTWLDDPCRPG
jgi:tRNA A37 N6-isopentenylltransferase MiaA